jgi:hypothetical protein
VLPEAVHTRSPNQGGGGGGLMCPRHGFEDGRLLPAGFARMMAIPAAIAIASISQNRDGMEAELLERIVTRARVTPRARKRWGHTLTPPRGEGLPMPIAGRSLRTQEAQSRKRWGHTLTPPRGSGLPTPIAGRSLRASCQSCSAREMQDGSTRIWPGSVPPVAQVFNLCLSIAAARGYPRPLAGRSSRPSRPRLSACPLRFAILAALAPIARSRAWAAPR